MGQKMRILVVPACSIQKLHVILVNSTGVYGEGVNGRTKSSGNVEESVEIANEVPGGERARVRNSPHCTTINCSGTRHQKLYDCAHVLEHTLENAGCSSIVHGGYDSQKSIRRRMVERI